MSSLPLTGVFNDGYIAGAYESYRRDPSSVDESWRQFFRVAEQLAGGGRTAGSYDASLLRKAAAAAELLGAIQKFGHLAVQLDPLGSPPPGAVELKPEFHGITDADLHQLPGSVLRPDADGTAADVIQAMRDHYCGALAYEFEYISEDVEREWFRAQIESGNATAPPLPVDECHEANGPTSASVQNARYPRHCARRRLTRFGPASPTSRCRSEIVG